MAKQHAGLGADVAVAHLPSYYPLTDDDILVHCERLAESIPIPLMLYNIPLKMVGFRIVASLRAQGRRCVDNRLKWLLHLSLPVNDR